MDARPKAQESALDPAQARFGIGQSVPRTEDPKLLRGEGRYTDDLNEPGQAHAVMVRSPVAHGRIRSIDASAALAMPGVIAVFTGQDLAYSPGLTCAVPIPNPDGTPFNDPMRPILPVDKVRHVGEAVAFVVAETAMQAKDAAEAVAVDYEMLPAAASMDVALGPDAPVLHDNAPDNVAVHYHYGDSEKVAAAFEAAHHVTRLHLVSQRLVVNPMEPRVALSSYDEQTQRWTLWVTGQGVYGLKGWIASALKVPPEKIRIRIGNVGGSFGMKFTAFPEYVAVMHAAQKLGRPVKWRDDRSESFLSDHHGRGTEMTCELALDRDGHFQAVRLSGYSDLGAWPVILLTFSINAARNVIGVYKTPLVEVTTRGVYTNTTPVAAYRGAGRPEGNYYMERLVDAAAAEMGIDRVELRRRNHIRPEAIPHKAPSGMQYDSGEFGHVLAQALDLADRDGYAARRRESAARGRLRGLGIGQYLEVTAGGGQETGALRFEDDGTVTILAGTHDHGQGHAAPFAQVLVDRLGIPFDKIRLDQSDSDQIIVGAGTGGSRSIMAAGAALTLAAAEVIEKGRAAAAHVLEAAAADIEFRRGRFAVAGTDLSVGVLELAARLRTAGSLPADVPTTLDVKLLSDNPISAYPNGCHVCEVEIDPETGVVEVVRYAAVNDFGVLINPMLVAGQTHGGIVQGIGQALWESAIYDEQGQLLTGSFMDYAMPRADGVPFLDLASHEVPATTNPLGAKGCGEAGCAGALPAVMNAVVDALSGYGITQFDMPATPERVWRAIRDARTNQAKWA